MDSPAAALFAGVAGIGFALILIKIATPVVLPSLFDTPGGLAEIASQPWPATWGIGLVAALAAAGLLCARLEVPRPAWAFGMPAAWLAWQFVAAWRSVDPGLTVRTLRHFTAAVVCFYLGWLVLGRVARQRVFWWAMFAGFVFVLCTGFRQYYAELPATREYVEANERTRWLNVPETGPEREEFLRNREQFLQRGILVRVADGYRANPEFLKRIQGGRVSATFGYPNALAGVILLLLPVMLAVLWQNTANWPRLAREVALALLGYMAMACLFWSGSKSGWLIALALAAVAGLHLPIPRKFKVAAVAAMLIAGTAGFAWKFSDYFKRGATSVGARVACWQVALRTATEHPLLGTGPGSFGRIYETKKRPDAEMARLAHNDYLEQASDSGLPGFAAYVVIWPVGLWVLYRGSRPANGGMTFAVWLGLAGWAAQSVVEFNLYMPALSWTAFLLLGWLWARHGTPNNSGLDKARSAR